MKNVKNALLEEKDSSLESVKGVIKKKNGTKRRAIQKITRKINNLNLTANSGSANLLKLQKTGAEVKKSALLEKDSSLENVKGLIKKKNGTKRWAIKKITRKINDLNLTANSGSANLLKLQKTGAEVKKSALLEEKHSSLENEKGLIKKKTAKQWKSKINNLNLTPKSEIANLLKLQKTDAEVKSILLEEKQSSLENEKGKIKKQNGKQQAKNKKLINKINNLILTTKNYSEQENTLTELTESQLINKYKKLKKQQKKSKNNCQNKSAAVAANSVQKTNSFDSGATKNADITNSKVLTKKERKAQKRQFIKDQKLSENRTRDPTVDDATVFVGNLSVNSNRKHLIFLFQKFGPIIGGIRLRTAGGKGIFNHKQRKNAGSLNAYVVLKNKETAEKALSLHGTQLNGHQLRVTLASNNSLSHENEEKRTVFVGNLKYSATEESLREIFSSCGEIDYVRCIRDGDNGCKGVAYVCFKRTDAVGLALELNKTIMDDRPLNVERYSAKKLGAKKAREAQEEDGYKKDGKQRLDVKKGKKEKIGYKKENRVEIDATKKSKKSEFRGVKVEGLKKQKSKKKKSRNQMLQLAKKIAPKRKT